MADELKDQRIPIMMSPSEVRAIDDWMFANRIKSRAEAIRRLCQISLGAEEFVDGIYKSFSEGVNVTKSFVETAMPAKEKGDRKSVEEAAANYSIELLRILKGLQAPVHDLRSLFQFYGKEGAETGDFILTARDFIEIMKTVDLSDKFPNENK